LLLVGDTLAYRVFWSIDRVEDALGLVTGLLLLLLACLTMWNAFYSLLWGFSGSLMHDLLADAELRDRERLIRSYEGEGPIDRICGGRRPNLGRGGWGARGGDRLRLRPRGQVRGGGTPASFRVFSLGRGGGVKAPARRSSEGQAR